VLPPKDRVHTSMEELIFQFKIVTDLRLPSARPTTRSSPARASSASTSRPNGTSQPLRCHIRAPGLMNVQAIPLLAEGRLLSDMVAIIGSLDFVMGEVDR
jgi:NADH-quinone oxidoreductase subunit D